MEKPSLSFREPFRDDRGEVRVILSSDYKGELKRDETYWLVSRNTRIGTVRGMHFQVGRHAERKLVSVLRGSILDLAVDVRPLSEDFGSIFRFTLSSTGCEELDIPPGFAHGYQTLEDDTIVSYALDSQYRPEASRTINPLSADLRALWPLPVTQISKSDKDAQTLEKFLKTAPVTLLDSPAMPLKGVRLDD